MIVDADRVHDRSVELVVTARATVPANPLNGAMVIVELATTPALTDTPDELALIVKLGMVVMS